MKADQTRRAGSEVLTRDVIGNYEVVRKIAVGGMGEVFLAKQKGPVDFSRHVVLKMLHPKYSSDPHFVGMFLNEARIAANLAHPNIIHIYELFEDGAGYAMAMEYVRGGTVLELLRAHQHTGGPGLPYGAMVRIATSVCDALQYAYNEPDSDGVPRHVIHRDVSPSNVLVGYDGQIKLVDFGIAKVLQGDAVTQATTIKGKYGYLTPEQIRCLPLDQRSDLFSLGTMLWEMGVGQPLFKRENELQMLYAILEERIPPPSERVPDFPRGLEYIIMKALARSRDDRYADAESLAHDLRMLARDNEWDCEAAPLGKLVKDLLPNDHIAFGRMGVSSDFSMSGLRATTEVGDPISDEFASIVVIDAAKVKRRKLTTANWVTIGIMLALTVVFWLLVVPRL